jgi:hypothetical protein
MRGFPKAIGSKQDMNNLLAMPEFAGQARAKLAAMEAAGMVWVTTKVITDGKPGITDETHKVMEAEVDGKLERRQMELQEDQTALFIRLGLKTLTAAPEPVAAVIFSGGANA